MTLYTVLEPPGGKTDQVKFIAEGFSWAGFLFTSLWALAMRMWLMAVLLILMAIALNIAFATDMIDLSIAILLQLGLMVIVGLEGRMFRIMSLERAGYRVTGLIEASGLEAAETAYFSVRKPQIPASVSGNYRSQPEDTLGIFGNV